MWHPQVAQLKRMRHVDVSTPVAELPEEATAVFGDKCVCIFVYLCVVAAAPPTRSASTQTISTPDAATRTGSSRTVAHILSEEYVPVPDAGPAVPRLPALVDFRRADDVDLPRRRLRSRLTFCREVFLRVNRALACMLVGGA